MAKGGMHERVARAPLYDESAGSAPLVETPQAVGAFMALFQELYGVPEPVLPLGSILHWIDVVSRLGIAGTSVDRAATRVFGGYFYNTSTRVPSMAAIDKTIAAGRARGVHQFLIPTVRNCADTGALVARGFRCIPWFIESTLTLDAGVAADLRSRLGRHRQRSIERVAEKVAARYPARYYELAEIEAEPAVLAIAAALHECNVRKYGHARNFYSAAILQRLCASPLGEQILLCIRRDADSGEPVQASISLIDRGRRQLYWLVQGIRREKVAAGYNLFIADAYQLFLYAEQNGIREINLSRGGQEQKLNLGANRFHLLNNWLLNTSPGAEVELAAIAARCREALGIGGDRPATIGAYRIH